MCDRQSRHLAHGLTKVEEVSQRQVTKNKIPEEAGARERGAPGPPATAGVSIRSTSCFNSHQSYTWLPVPTNLGDSCQAELGQLTICPGMSMEEETQTI